jgi:stage II sporulation protein M
MLHTYRMYSKEVMPIYLFVCILFLMGIVFGALIVNALTMQQKQEVGQYVNSFFHSADEVSANQVPVETSSFADTLWSHVRWLLFIWLLGLSIAGAPLILLLNFLKGLLLGFTIGFLSGQWAWKGLVIAFIAVAPQNLVIVPAMIICSVSAISFSALFIQTKLFQHSRTIAKPLGHFTSLTFMFVGLMIIVTLLEMYVSPALLRWVTPMLLGGV